VVRSGSRRGEPRCSKGAADTPQAGQALPSLFPLHTVGPGVGGDQLAFGPAHASNGYSNYMPNLTFGGPTPNAPTYANGNPEYSNNNLVDTFKDNFSKVWGSHSIKGGFYLEFNRKVQPCGSAGCNGYTLGPSPTSPGSRPRRRDFPTRAGSFPCFRWS
jgi:hypothetical protein